MLILIAESKTMTRNFADVDVQAYRRHTPLLADKAGKIMRDLRTLTASELSRTTGLSGTMTARLIADIHDFPDKDTGMKAIEAFTGVVFKALSPSTLTAEAMADASGRLRILSSLYGILRPEDIIKPYRLDFTTRAAPGDRTLADFWRQDVTDAILAELARTGTSDIVDLLPADAARCLDRKATADAARIWKINFRQVDGRDSRTPHATRLKTLRGLLLRQILETGADSPQQIAALESPQYYCDIPPETTPDGRGGCITFTTA